MLLFCYANYMQTPSYICHKNKLKFSMYSIWPLIDISLLRRISIDRVQ